MQGEMGRDVESEEDIRLPEPSLPPRRRRDGAPKFIRNMSPPFFGVFCILLFLTFIAAVTVFGFFVSFSYGDPTGTRSVDALYAVLVYIAVQKAVLLSVLTAIFFFEWRSHRKMSKLLPIFILSELTNEGYFIIIAARALDALHDSHIMWQALYTPTVRMLLTTFILLLPFVDMVFIGTIARGYGWAWKRIVTDFILIALVVAILEYLLIAIL
jgi:hypothetical protein